MREDITRGDGGPSGGNARPFVGTAGWSIPGSVADRFAPSGSGLSRYASVFNGVEINSTFYRRHRPETFQRWRESVPSTFRFAAKIPKHITHDLRLAGIEAAFAEFLEDVGNLGPQLGPLLCQLPPSLKFGSREVEQGLRAIRAAFDGSIVIEPRHPTWASEAARAMLRDLSLARVLADPPVIWDAATFRTAPRYIRLHGKPKVYYSAYSKPEIAAVAESLGPESWCIFDNTASGAAIDNALTLRASLAGDGGGAARSM